MSEIKVVEEYHPEIMNFSSTPYVRNDIHQAVIQKYQDALIEVGLNKFLYQDASLEIDRKRSIIVQNGKDKEALEQKCAEYEKALEFYADKNNWYPYEHTYSYQGGERARKVLERYGK